MELNKEEEVDIRLNDLNEKIRETKISIKKVSRVV